MSEQRAHIVVVCNYELRPDRIGGMDRFFVAYDAFAKANNLQITWFFSKVTPFDFYNDLTIRNAEGGSVEQYFLNELAISQENYDVLITHFTSLCSSFYKKASGLNPFKKVIVVDHNPRPLEGFSIKKRIKNRIKGLLYHTYIDQFVGVSKYTSRHIIKDLGKQVSHKTTTIYNGIELPVIEEVENQKGTGGYTENNKLKLIVVSHLRKSKGIQDAIAAVSLLEAHLINKLQIFVYGTGPIEEELQAMVQKNNLGNTIQFMGSSPEIPKLLPCFDYLLQPTYMECFSLSILESLAANVPVITTTVGGNPEVITDGENGFLFEAMDVLRLKEILEDTIKGKLSIKNETRTLVKHRFNLDRMVKEHFKLIYD